MFDFKLFRHFVKGIKKRIYKASRSKSCASLMGWQTSITKTIHYAIRNCQGLYSSAEQLLGNVKLS